MYIYIFIQGTEVRTKTKRSLTKLNLEGFHETKRNIEGFHDRPKPGEEGPRRPPPTLPAGKTGSGSSQERQPKRKRQAEANGWAAIHKRR